MSIEDIRTLRMRRPFRPFTITTNDGRFFEVDKAERIALSHRGHQVSVFHGDLLVFLNLDSIRRVEENASSSRH